MHCQKCIIFYHWNLQLSRSAQCANGSKNLLRQYVMTVYNSKWKYETYAVAAHVPQTSQNLVISCFAEDDKEMHKDLLCTYRATVLLIVPLFHDFLVAISIVVCLSSLITWLWIGSEAETKYDMLHIERNDMSCHISSLLKVSLFEMASGFSNVLSFCSGKGT